jgi:transcription initiation factor TFIIIB Brf1 subunit/transcription initiation factor TFIIB
MKIKKEQPVCPKCNSKNIIAQIKIGNLTCRRCGYIGKREEFFEGVQKIVRK